MSGEGPLCPSTQPAASAAFFVTAWPFFALVPIDARDAPPARPSRAVINERAGHDSTAIARRASSGRLRARPVELRTVRRVRLPPGSATTTATDTAPAWASRPGPGIAPLAQRLAVDMETSDWSDYLDSVDGRVTLLLGILTVISLIRKRDKQHADSLADRLLPNRPKRQKGMARHSSAVVAVPLRTHVNRSAEDLARTTRLWGRVPLNRSRSGLRLFGLGRRIRCRALAHQTAPKGAFVVERWQYTPHADSSMFGGPAYSGSFELKVKVHPSENRRHLRRSLMAARGRHRDRRLVVIAATPDMADPAALVRCLFVDARFGLELDRNAPGCITMQASELSLDERPTAFLERQDGVSDAALWLIVPLSNHRPATRFWGHISEKADVARAVPGFEDSLVGDQGRDGVQRALIVDRVLTALWWLAFGPATFVVARWLRSDLAGASNAGSASLLESVSAWVIAVYFGALAWLAIYAFVDLIWQSVVAASWRRDELQSPWYSPERGFGAIMAAFLPIRGRRHGRPRWNGGTRSCMQVHHHLLHRSPPE